MKAPWIPTLHPAIAASALAVAALACNKPMVPPPGCDFREIPADPSTSAPRPDIAKASFEFHGNNLEQHEFIFLHGDGRYDYVERWNLGVPHEGKLQETMGWDWKVGCQVHQCPLPNGTVCCYQSCRDGGASGDGYEAPDQFGCMNKTDGGPYDWFLKGLRDNAMPELAACFQKADAPAQSSLGAALGHARVTPPHRDAAAPRDGECRAEAPRDRDAASRRG